MKLEIRKIQNPSRSNFQWGRYAVFKLKIRSRSNQQEFDQRCSRFSEGEAQSMKPEVVWPNIGRFLDLVVFRVFNILGVFIKMEGKAGTMD